LHRFVPPPSARLEQLLLCLRAGADARTPGPAEQNDVSAVSMMEVGDTEHDADVLADSGDVVADVLDTLRLFAEQAPELLEAARAGGALEAVCAAMRLPAAALHPSGRATRRLRRTVRSCAPASAAGTA
jgi:hypothetical protein